jgi:hypothetical protein
MLLMVASLGPSCSSEIQPEAGIGGDQDFDIGPNSEPFSMSIVGQ